MRYVVLAAAVALCAIKSFSQSQKDWSLLLRADSAFSFPNVNRDRSFSSSDIFSTMPEPTPGLYTYTVPSQPWGSGNIPIPNYYPDHEYSGPKHGPQSIPLYRERTPGTIPLPPYYPDLKLDSSSTSPILTP